jgi:hypothetical protein
MVIVWPYGKVANASPVHSKVLTPSFKNSCGKLFLKGFIKTKE